MGGPARRCWHPNWWSAVELKHLNPPVHVRCCSTQRLNVAWPLTQVLGESWQRSWACSKPLRCHFHPALSGHVRVCCPRFSFIHRRQGGVPLLKKKLVSALILAGASLFTVFNFFSLFFSGY